MRCAVFLYFLALIPSLTWAENLPRAGTCEHRRVFTEDFVISTTLDWRGSDATIRARGSVFTGQVVGLREHDAGFKLSVLYTDEIMGDSEMVVFSLPDSEPVEYLMGIVTYEELDDDLRVVKSISPFEDVVCAVIFY